MENVLAMPKGERNKFWGSFYAVACRFSHIKGGGSFHLQKGEREMFYPVLRGGGGTKSFGPTIFTFCSHPPPHRLLMTSP